MTIILVHKINVRYLILKDEELEVGRPEPDATITTISAILILAVMISP
jgi:hypothetical protein